MLGVLPGGNVSQASRSVAEKASQLLYELLLVSGCALMAYQVVCVCRDVFPFSYPQRRLARRRKPVELGRRKRRKEFTGCRDDVCFGATSIYPLLPSHGS